MTSFNWQRIRESPIKFTGIIAWYGVHAVLLSLYRLATPLRPHSTNYVTAMKSLLLRTVFLKHYQFIYSTPPAALKAARCIKREGWSAYEFDANQNISLRHYDVVMLYFHGGGYAIGEPLQYAATYKRWKREAARRNIQLAIVGLRYRGNLSTFVQVWLTNTGFQSFNDGRKTIPSSKNCWNSCVSISD